MHIIEDPNLEMAPRFFRNVWTLCCNYEKRKSH